MPNEKKDPGGVGVQIDSIPERPPDISQPNLPVPLTLEEKKYLLAVERGDIANVRRIIQRAHRRQHININCVDPLGRGALTLAIDGENLEMVELLIIMGVETKDGLLQAINAEFVEAVELLLEHEELIHKDGEPYSWQKTDLNTAMFTPDVTPLMLAAHRNNYEIIKILLDRGATLPMPHDIKCGCDDCIRQSSEDSLRHSLSRVNEYRALSSPSLIALSSNDPLLTAFQLSWELRNLAFAEQECKTEYLELRRQCQQFAVDLLDQSRSSQELAIILNHDPESIPYMDGDHMKLTRLELAINYKQKKFVAHPNIQQLLAAMWYEGVPGFRRKSALEKMLITIKVAALFPLYCTLYMIAPNCSTGKFMRKPFMKFLIHASSYLFFLFVLILVSQRAEVQVIQLFGTESMKRALEEELLKQRGAGPTYLELLVVVYVLGFIWEETQEIYVEGIQSYLRNMWNFIDFARNFLYCLVALLRIVAYIQQTTEISRDPSTAYIAREHWDDFDPQLIAEGLFAAANIFSALKLVHMFSINPHLGPLQISLGRMVIDIVKFFFIYSLVLFAFACGLNQLLWYFADLEKKKCYVLPGGLPDWDNNGDACMKWRRFGNLFESSQSLFWASFGTVGLESFELAGIKSYTRFWGLLMFGSYSVINVIVLLNLLIAMMSNSYAMIDEHSDTEWKFARTKLWMSYFEESSTLPPPFNIFPTVKVFYKLFGKKSKRTIERQSTIRRKEERERDNRYTNVMRSLVWRYVSAMHRRMEEDAVTEDDINEVKGEISAMRYEMLEVFERNGMDVSSADRKEKTVLAKRMKVWERRLMKDFQVAPVATEEGEPEDPDVIPENETSLSKFRRVAQKVVHQSSSYKWGQVINEVAVGTNSQIGRCRNRSSFKNQQNLQKAMEEARRLVERGGSGRSRSVSPIAIDDIDQTTNTLMQLLKNISDENNEISPGNTLAVHLSNSRSVSPGINELTRHLQSAITPRMQSKNAQSKTKPAFLQNIESNTKESNAPQTSKILKSPSPSKSEKSAPYTSPPLSSSDPLSPYTSPPPEPQIDPNICKSPPPPSIHITRTESQSKKDDGPVKIEIHESNEKKGKEVITPPKVVSPPPLISKTSPPKVIKRKPASSSKPSDIAVSRPIVTKPAPGQGMIPPPPESPPKVDASPPLIDIQLPTPTPSPTMSSNAPKPIPPPSPVRAPSPLPLSRSPSPIPGTVVMTPRSPTPAKLPSAPSTPTPTPIVETESMGSQEKLVKSTEPASDANKAANSPPCLRPVHKIDDVRTIKRQPKTGWL